MGYLSLDFLLSLCSVLRAAIVDIIIQRARYRNTHRSSFPRARLDTPSSVCSHMEGGHENLQSDTTSTQCARQREEEEEKQKNNNEIPLGPNSLFSSCCDRRDAPSAVHTGGNDWKHDRSRPSGGWHHLVHTHTHTNRPPPIS